MSLTSDAMVRGYFLLGLIVLIVVTLVRGEDERTRRVYVAWKALSLLVVMAWMLWETYRALTGP